MGLYARGKLKTGISTYVAERVERRVAGLWGCRVAGLQGCGLKVGFQPFFNVVCKGPFSHKLSNFIGVLWRFYWDLAEHKA